jgi:hypothetical protein
MSLSSIINSSNNLEIKTDFVIQVGENLEIPLNHTLHISATITNKGTITNNGTIDNTGTIDNNEGSVMNNNEGSVMNNNRGGNITNDGIINNNKGSVINNKELIDNFYGGIINNKKGGIINNSYGGIINNSYGGKINNNDGSIINNNQGSILTNNEYGIINNNDGSIIYNNEGGVINNKGKAEFYNTGIFVDKGTYNGVPYKIQIDPEFIFTLQDNKDNVETINVWMRKYIKYLTLTISPIKSEKVILNGSETGFDLMGGEDVKLTEWLVTNPKGFVIKLGKEFHLFEDKEDVIKLLNDPGKITFGCKTDEFDMHFVPSKDEIKLKPYFHIKSLLPTGVCDIFDILSLIQDKDNHKYYEVRKKKKETILVSTTTLARINDIGDAVGDAHCQKGQEEIVYEIIRLIPTQADTVRKTKAPTLRKTQAPRQIRINIQKKRQTRTRRRINPQSEYSAGGRKKTRRVKKKKTIKRS